MIFNSFIFLNILALLTSCNGQGTIQNNNTGQYSEQAAKGDTVKELGNNIMVVYQDRKNVYWFGSWETGVYRYDARLQDRQGKTIINYTTNHGLLNNRVDEIKEDKSGNIYFSSCSPLSVITKFDGKTFTKVPVKKSSEWKLQADDLWFKNAYQTEKVYRYDGSVLHELQLPKPSGLSIPFEIYSIYKDSKGNVWFGTNPVGVCRYNGKSFDWITEDDVIESQGPANGVRSITEDKKGYFWFNSAFVYNVYGNLPPDSKIFYQRQKSIGSLDGKKDGNLVEYLSSLRDDDNNLWFATYRDGVWKYDGSKVTHYAVRQNSANIKVFSIYKDNNGDLWLGTHENGAFKFNGTQFEKFTP